MTSVTQRSSFAMSYGVEPGYDKVGVSQSVTACIFVQFSYIGRGDVVFDLIQKLRRFPIVPHSWRSCCNKLHIILVPVRVPLCMHRMSNKNAIPFDNRSGVVVWLICRFQVWLCWNHVAWARCDTYLPGPLFTFVAHVPHKR